jgi:H/ACA ribonucleoprotein complex subunit 1
MAVYRLTSEHGIVPLTQTFLFDACGQQVGRVKDVFGPMGDVYFSMEPDNPELLQALNEGDKVFAPRDRLRSEDFFLNDAPMGRRGGSRGRGPRGGGRGGARGRRRF